MGRQRDGGTEGQRDQDNFSLHLSVSPSLRPSVSHSPLPFCYFLFAFLALAYFLMLPPLRFIGSNVISVMTAPFGLITCKPNLSTLVGLPLSATVARNL